MSEIKTGEATFREDERQACWEDFVRVLRNAVGNKMTVKELAHRIFQNGWKDLGTGDGKPQHRQERSAVNEWMDKLYAEAVDQLGPDMAKGAK